MVDTKRQEEISKSYLNALCATKGISMEDQVHDDDSIDVILKRTIRRADSSWYNASISVQLKSTSSDYTEFESHYSYPLKKKNYDDLRMRATIKPYLFLLLLPRDENEWVTHSIEQLIIRKCMYWLDLEGLPDKENTSTVSVHLLKTNVVSSDALVALLHDVAEEVRV